MKNKSTHQISYSIGYRRGKKQCNKKELIDKACIFIRQNIDLYAMDTVDARTMKHKIVLMTDFEKVFHKAMEE